MNPVQSNVPNVGVRGSLLELVLRVFLNPTSTIWHILQSYPVNDVGVKGLYIAQIIERRIEDEENSSHR